MPTTVSATVKTVTTVRRKVSATTTVSATVKAITAVRRKVEA
jgi:hypothetical protein